MNLSLDDKTKQELQLIHNQIYNKLIDLDYLLSNYDNDNLLNKFDYYNKLFNRIEKKLEDL